MSRKPKHNPRETCYRVQKKPTVAKDISTSWEKRLLKELKKQK